MQQPLNYPYPPIFWVDSSASSPWASPGSVFPCPSSVPGRPGQRRPPPPPPPTLPPPPPLPPLPPPPLKKRRDHNTGLCLLVMFFMVLVALVGLGLGIFQLFHLQKELAELRESTSQRHTASSLEKQIGHPSPPSEKKELKKAAHLTGKLNSRSIPLEWEDTYGIALVSGVKYKKGSLVLSVFYLPQEAYGKVLHAEERQDQLRAKGLFSEKSKSKDLIGSRWLIKEELEEMLVEKLSDQDYAQFIRLLERLSALPCDAAEEEFVGRFRRTVTVQSKKHLIEPLQYDEQGMAFSTGQGKRKTANAEAVVYGHGSGKIEINGVDYLLYFPVTQDREQLMFPFHFLDRLGKHDVTCTVSGGGRSSQAGAIRLAMSRALCSFITEDEVEWMRQAGLLTTDPRVRERKKPGQEGARRKFTWKKR